MGNKKSGKCLMALALSAVMLFPAPMTYAEERLETAELGIETHVESGTADENGFVIENGVLTRYEGTATEVVIPDSVTSIGDSAFFNCSGLTGIIIPDSVMNIGDSAFWSCSGLTGIIIPDSVTSIGEYAFQYCSGLENVTIPSSVTSIGEYAFSFCKGLISIIVEKGNTRYDSRDNCNAIIETESNTLICGCKNTVIPGSVTSIGDAAFRRCSGLTSVIIPKGVTSIGDTAFSNCEGLTSIIVEKGNIKYDSRDNCNAIIETESNMLVCGCKNSVIPDSVMSIGDAAFQNCEGLASVTIPSSVTSIGERAFLECYELTSVTIPDSVTSIGEYSFFECDRLESVIIPDSVTSIGESAFEGCNAKLVIYGKAGSYAEDYARQNHIEFSTGEPPQPSEKKEFSYKDVTLILSQTSYVYDGEAKTPTVTVKYTDEILEEGIDYTVDYQDNVNAGTAKVIVTGMGNYTGTVTKTFTITQNQEVKEISECTITLSQTSYTYDGKAKTPSVTVKLEGKTLTLNTDYTVSYSDNINAGTAKVTVTGKGNYTGSKTVNFTITVGVADISKATVTLDKTSYNYDGKAKTPSVTVKLDGKTLTLNTDYTASYSDNINAGTAKVTVTGKGDYTGSKTINFTIVKAGQDSSITCKKTLYKVAYGTKPFKINAASKSKLTFTSSKPKIVSVDKDTGRVTIKNTGVAIITIKAGKDSVKVTVKVSPKKQDVKSVNVSKGKKLTVKWAKDKTASGYQVQVSIDKKFKKGVKSKNLSKTSYTFTKLKAGKKYYVRMRSYKKSGKETLYSTWSKTKTSNKVKK